MKESNNMYLTQFKKAGLALTLLVTSLCHADSNVLRKSNVTVNQNHQHELKYLAEAIYFEARGELTAGQLAVGQVIMNRVKSTRFPNTIEEVVHQRGWSKKHGKFVCQFSYYCDGKTDTMYNEESQRKSYTIASLILTGDFIVDIVDLADHYVNRNLAKPKWLESMIYIGEVGYHSFYKAK